MADDRDQVKSRSDFSGGVQKRTSIALTRDNQVDDALNASFSKSIGAVGKNLGYTQQNNDLTSTTSTSTSSSTTTTSTSSSTSTSTSTSTTTTA